MDEGDRRENLIRIEKDVVQGKGKAIAVDKPPRWIRPPPGFVKLNVDGAWKSSSEAAGRGVIRTPSGDAELYAIREGLEMEKEFKIKFMEVETDAEVLTRMLFSATTNPHHEAAAVLLDVAHLLCLKSWTVYVVHIPRERNKVAHKLAQYAMNMTLGWYPVRN
ncbi:uncharacterized protein LOC110715880 [Chenopodium quinoa]|uniref:uncharacterized protein LOC110715880 n=1 Tax=Chenopodium quinoa TaxID=63459 RepID=UPI000B776C76|nr:uncharacterized protein LOC110715880 [Chenopodium quinoa]